MATIFTVKTEGATASFEITDEVRRIVRESGVVRGLCHVMALHSTAAVVVNENADPNIGADLRDALDRAVPRRAGWRHDEIDGNAAAHIKGAILGPSETLPVEDGDLSLGAWQTILFIEFDGPRERRVSVQVIPANPAGPRGR